MSKSVRSVRYETITAELRQTTRWALLLDYEGDEQWIPRSCIENAADFDHDDCDEEHDFSVVAWKLDELGWEA